jgi:hypothetical protein
MIELQFPRLVGSAAMRGRFTNRRGLRPAPGAAVNMFRLSTRDSMTGFKAASYVSDHFGGPNWKDVQRAEIAFAEPWHEDTATSAREKLKARLDQIRLRTHGLNDDETETVEDAGNHPAF